MISFIYLFIYLIFLNFFLLFYFIFLFFSIYVGVEFLTFNCNAQLKILISIIAQYKSINYYNYEYEPRKVRHICHERGQEYDRCLLSAVLSIVHWIG